MTIVHVPTKEQIASKLLALADTIIEAATVAAVAAEIGDELGKLQCDVANRAKIDCGERQAGETVPLSHSSGSSR